MSKGCFDEISFNIMALHIKDIKLPVWRDSGMADVKVWNMH